MSNIENVKIIGAVLAVSIIVMLSGFITELVYEPEQLEEHAYVVATGAESAAEEETETAEPEPEPEPVAALIAAADTGAGQKTAKKCTACHSTAKDGANKIGPKLWDIVGRPVASVAGFSYSGGLKKKAGETWSYANLDAFLAKPKDWAPGTKMTFAGLKNAEKRAALIAFLRTLSDSPAPLPE
ncbi:MAG: cytochrome c family protein [Kiloniellales bacterium]